ncbi:MAG: hypothetical protein IT534_05000 [Bauldia sp.]|nr:hypothetical protein [Bauldia sp.]
MIGTSVSDTSPARQKPLLRDVLARLDGARRRAVLRGLGESVAMAIAAGLAAWCLLRLGFALAWTPVSATTLALAAGAVALAALAIGFVSALAESPSRLALARRADAALGLRERISTAVEVADAVPTVVSAALVADAERRAGAIRPAAILPRRGFAPVVPMALLAVFAAALLLAPLPPASAPDRALPPSLLVGATEAETIAAELRTLAAEIAADAAERDDPFLAAIATATAATAQNLADGTPVERAPLAAELARLGEYAAAAYGATGAPSGRAEALSRIAGATAAGRGPTGAAAAPPSGGGPDAAPGAAGDPAGSTAPGAAGEAGTPERLRPEGAAGPDTPSPGNLAARPAAAPEITGTAVQEICNFDAGADCAAAGGDNPFGLERGNVDLPPDPGGATPPNAAEGPAMANGQLVGPAADAGAGEAVFAGQGTRPLGDVPVDGPGPLPGGGTMLLRDRGTGTGDRIRIDMPPPAGGAAVLEAGTPPAGDWRTLPEAPVARPLLPPAERAVAARYFVRPAETE